VPDTPEQHRALDDRQQRQLLRDLGAALVPENDSLPQQLRPGGKPPEPPTRSKREGWGVRGGAAPPI
jgi:hypothetical protein